MEAEAKPPKANKKSQAEAKAAFLEGQKLFKAEEYALALPLFQKAYKLSNRKPTSILALAQCERMNKMYDKAISRFKEFLATKPKPKLVERVNETLKILEKLQAQAKQDEDKRLAEEQRKEEERKKETERIAQELAQKMAVPAPPAPAKSEFTKEDSIWSSPWLWLGIGVVVAGAGTTAGFLLNQPEDIYQGTTGVTLTPQ